jgi:hypothetical protein
MKFFSRDRFLEFDLDIYPIGKPLFDLGLKNSQMHCKVVRSYLWNVE